LICQYFSAYSAESFGPQNWYVEIISAFWPHMTIQITKAKLVLEFYDSEIVLEAQFE